MNIPGILLLVTFSIFMIISFVHVGYLLRTDKDRPIASFLIATIMMFCVYYLIYSLGNNMGQGYPASELKESQQLQESEVYQVVNSMELRGGGFLVLIRDKYDNERIYKLDLVPPKIFKKSGDEKNPYRNFP